MRRNVFRALLPLMALPLMVACPFQQGKDDSEQTNLMLMITPARGDCMISGIRLDLSGNRTDTWGTSHSIYGINSLIAEQGCHWDSSGSGNTTYSNIVEFDNTSKILYKNVTGCTLTGWCTTGYSRVFWTSSGGNTYYCDENYGQATLAAAKSDPVNANTGDLGGGCNGFPWSQFQ